MCSEINQYSPQSTACFSLLYFTKDYVPLKENFYVSPWALIRVIKINLLLKMTSGIGIVNDKDHTPFSKHFF